MNSSSASSPTSTEACDFCRAPLAEIHQHVMECATRTLECACDACAILFGGQDQKYRRVPRRTRYLPQFRMTDAQWSALMIPIGIAFLFRRDASGKIAALYPSPAGPVESRLTLDAWEEIAKDNPEIRSMETDVEGLLIYRVGSASEHYIIPIDECFKLVGIIRMNWKGFSGGMLVWQEIGKFLERLKQRSTTRAAA
jgi:Family of unknown function (DUF5947)